MGLVTVSWEYLRTDEQTSDTQWKPYPHSVATRLEAVFLHTQVVGQKPKSELVEFNLGLHTYQVELRTWSQSSLADGSVCPVRRNVVEAVASGSGDPGTALLLSIPASAKIVFTRGIVWIEPRMAMGGESKPAGRLMLLRDADTFSLCWLPAYERYSRDDLTHMKLWNHAFSQSLEGFYSFRRKDNRLYATLAQNGQPSSSLPPFIFEAGDAAVKAFLAVMQMNLETAGDQTPSIKRVLDNVNLFVVEQPMTSEAVKKAAVKLVKDGLVHIQNTLPEAEQVRWRIMEGASAVTAFLRRAASADAHHLDGASLDNDYDDMSFQLEGEDMVAGRGGGADADSAAAAATASPHASSRPGAVGEGAAGDGGNANAQGVTVERSASESESNGRVLLGDLGTFDLIGLSVPPQSQRPQCPRGKPVDKATWDAHVSEDGTVKNEAVLREKIFRGGLTEEVRAAGWKLLLGFRPPPGESPEVYYERRQKEYEVMKLQWVSVSEKQYANNAAFRERIERVAKDVGRTDRETEYFKESGPHLEALGAILCTWCMYNFDQGYVQGMSDLAAVILSVVDDEVTAFWCFIGLMDTEHGANENFATDQLGMKGHLEDLATLVRFVDPGLMASFDESGCGNMFFAFRWLLIFLKREFTVPDVIRLWEVMWTKHLTPKYHIFFCLAILEMYKDELIHKDFDHMLQFVNSLSGSIDVDKVMCRAESLCRHILSCTRLPPKIQAFFPQRDDAVEASRDTRDHDDRPAPSPTHFNRSE
eukprot:m.22621 g.22621  ORF g.22621 m.22621 type:complete len:759 (-) comp4006_c0_seq1:11-2287(-)